MSEKTYVFGDGASNGMLSLLGPLMQQRGIDPNVLLAMRNNDGFGGEGGWFIWILFLLFFAGGWGNNGFGNNANNAYGANCLLSVSKNVDVALSILPVPLKSGTVVELFDV